MSIVDVNSVQYSLLPQARDTIALALRQTTANFSRPPTAANLTTLNIRKSLQYRKSRSYSVRYRIAYPISSGFQSLYVMLQLGIDMLKL